VCGLCCGYVFVVVFLGVILVFVGIIVLVVLLVVKEVG